jgi:predicted Zn finger-like uncharacterized protein
MFEELLRELKRMNGRHEVAVSLPSDADGYFDRECPSAECLAQFKVHEDDWRDGVDDQRVHCPSCGHTADARQWFTQEQIEHAEQAALAQFERRIGAAMKRDARNWNVRQPRNAFLKITMKIEDGPRQVLLPPAVVDPMRLKIACPACACRYAVIGSAFFCPSCGHNSADQMFTQAIRSIRLSLDAIDVVRQVIADPDVAETTRCQLLENGVQATVTAFQRYAEALHARCPGVKPPRRNAFQNIAEGSALWHAATSRSYDDYLSASEMATLVKWFQQRHLLAHTQGIVDADYLARTSDTSYQIGQRIVVNEVPLREFVTVVDKLASRLGSDVP